MQRKGQAAMEFLMTYGWAILAAIIAIGVLAYFGVFSPGTLAGSSAIINNPFYADSWQVLSGTPPTVNLEVVNNGGDTLSISSITVNGTGNSATINCGNSTTTSLAPGVKTLLAVPCQTGSLSAGNAFAGNIKVIYNKQGSSLSSSSTGTVRASAQ